MKCQNVELDENIPNKSSEKHLYIRKIIIRSIFNLGLASTRFITIRPCLQQVNLTSANRKPAVEQWSTLKKHNYDLGGTSPQYNHVILEQIFCFVN